MRFKLNLGADPKKIFVTSDNHWGHRLMATHYRGFGGDADRMDRVQIQRWNDVVPSDGIVIAFGDWSFRNLDETQRIMDQLNGDIYLIPGNHDSSSRIEKWFPADRILPEMVNVRVGERPDRVRFVASHYPLASWDGSDKGSLMLHGHLHSRNNSVSHHFCAPYEGAGNRFDIGIDNAAWFGYPLSPVPLPVVWKKHLKRQAEWAELKDDPRYK